MCNSGTTIQVSSSHTGSQSFFSWLARRLPGVAKRMRTQLAISADLHRRFASVIASEAWQSCPSTSKMRCLREIRRCGSQDALPPLRRPARGSNPDLPFLWVQEGTKRPPCLFIHFIFILCAANAIDRQYSSPAITSSIEGTRNDSASCTEHDI